MIAEIGLSGKSDARGRNGWFKPVRIALWEGGNGFEIGVSSKQTAHVDPIILDLTPEDTRIIVAFLRDNADIRGILPIAPCPNCDDGCLIAIHCDGCDVDLCQGCYDEHNKDAPCHVGGCDA